jgi:hypothetical protein
MKRYVMAGLGMALAAAAGAADFDGSRKLICAPVQVMDCIAGDGCEKGIPAEFGAPAFMRVDVQGKKVSGPKVQSDILGVERSEKQMLLNGRELGYGWVMAIDAKSGEMTLSLTNRLGAFVMFGNCTPL